MLLNLSNHPTAMWLPEQLEAAHSAYGEIIDLPFPSVPADADEAEIHALAQTYLRKVQNTYSPAEVTIHIMGEMTFTYTLVYLLKEAGYICVASTTKRKVYEKASGKKTSVFHFVRFREY